MAESKVHCVTFGHPIPEGQEHPEHFAQHTTDAQKDDPYPWVMETYTLCGSAHAVFSVLAALTDDRVKSKDDEDVDELIGLGWALAREIERRAELADQARTSQVLRKKPTPNVEDCSGEF